jgi:hypothetical protein
VDVPAIILAAGVLCGECLSHAAVSACGAGLDEKVYRRQKKKLMDVHVGGVEVETDVVDSKKIGCAWTKGGKVILQIGRDGRDVMRCLY